MWPKSSAGLQLLNQLLKNFQAHFLWVCIEIVFSLSSLSFDDTDKKSYLPTNDIWNIKSNVHTICELVTHLSYMV